MYWIEFNGIRNKEYGAEVTTRPSVPAPAPRGDYVQVAGRDGQLLITDGTYENIEISVTMNFVRPRNSLGNAYRTLKAWLRGSGVLKLSDDPDVHYRVKAVGILENLRVAKTGQEIVVTFICDPYTYHDSGKVPVVPNGTILNPYEESYPVYKITGDGDCTLTVNGHSVTARVAREITIDRDLMIAYKEDKTVVNSATRGDFLPLTLKHGTNEVSVSSGFGLTIIPNWRSL